MTVVATRLESCLWTLNLFETFSGQPTFTCMILETTINHKIILVLVFPKFWLDLNFIEMPRLGVSSVNSRIWLLKLDLRINFANCFKDQRRPLFVLLLSCFVCYPVAVSNRNIFSFGIFKGAETLCVSVCTKRVCARNTEPKACTLGIYIVHKNLGICTV